MTVRTEDLLSLIMGRLPVMDSCLAVLAVITEVVSSILKLKSLRPVML